MKPASVFQWIASIASAALVLWAGWWLRGCAVQDGTVEPRTEVVYVDREITKRDTVTIDRPVTRTIYEETTDTVYIEVPVPTDFRPYGLISSSPVRIDGTSVTLSYWNPVDLRWMQDTYEVRDDWNVWADAGLWCLGYFCSLDTRLNVRYKRLRGFIGYGVLSGVDVRHGVTWGVRIRIW